MPPRQKAQTLYDDDQLLDVREVAALIRCTTRHVYRMVERDEFPRPLHPGGTSTRWRMRDYRRWLEGIAT